MMKKIILALYVIGTLLFAATQKEHKQLSYDLSLTLLQSIKNDAIVYGKGKKIIYAFIDPLCPHSRKFVSMVSKNPKMQSKYQYHFFLYTLPRLKSTEVVSAVYMSPTPVKTLLDIMIDDKVQKKKSDEATAAKVNRIDNVAKEMDVYKRPYIFVVHEE